MSTYIKIWLCAFGALMSLFLFLIIYAGATSENSGKILLALEKLDTLRVSNITVSPRNVERSESLKKDNIVVTDRVKMQKVISALKKIEEKHVSKVRKIVWECILILHLDSSYSYDLKSNNSIMLVVYNTNEGLFVELTNVMGYTTYSCPDLKHLLEEFTSSTSPSFSSSRKPFSQIQKHPRVADRSFAANYTL